LVELRFPEFGEFLAALAGRPVVLQPAKLVAGRSVLFRLAVKPVGGPSLFPVVGLGMGDAQSAVNGPVRPCR